MSSDSGIAGKFSCFALLGHTNGTILLVVRAKRMRKPRSALLLFVLLFLGLSWAVPAEDVAETAYDESESLPYESTPLISNVMPQAAASATQAAPSAPRRQRTTPFPGAAMRNSRTDAHRFAEARVTLALLCTLLC